MEFQFENIEIIKDVKTFDSVRVYFEGILSFATTQGLLKHPDGDNEYSRELGRIGHLLAQYESDYQNFEPLRFKSPLMLSIATPTTLIYLLECIQVYHLQNLWNK
jgi:hypothetical protein